MTASTLSRSQRAMRLCMRTAKTWSVGVVGINVPSQTTAGVVWHTTLDSCDCPDARYRVGKPGGPTACKHSLAAKIFMGRNAA